MRIALFAGTRPELIKTAAVIREAQRRSRIELLFVHTSQHYDWELSQRFFDELCLPKPVVFLNVKSGSQGVQTSRVICRAEAYLTKEKPDYVLVAGDTNSALGAALASSKLHIPVGHIEAGCRSFDSTMPEELNRTMITRCSTVHFAPTPNTYLNLLREGTPPNSIHLTGHPLVKTIDDAKPSVDKSTILQELDLKPLEFAIMTLHRAENVDEKSRLKDILEAAAHVSKKLVFAIHPRTNKRIRQFHLSGMLKDTLVISPVGYFDMLKLIKCSSYVLTDSGGVQQETALLGTPCLTLRNNTEWVETIQYGLNTLAGNTKTTISKAIKKIEKQEEITRQNQTEAPLLFGDKKAANRILDILSSQSHHRNSELADQAVQGYPTLKLINVKKEVASKKIAHYLPFINMIFDDDGFPLLPRNLKNLQKGCKILVYLPQARLGGLVSAVQD